VSAGFYGVDRPTAYELHPTPDALLMQCRHCIRYSLGYCVRRGGARPTWHERLYLRLGDGCRFRLEFDCRNCQMNLYSTED
jgi:putative protease